jgi:hypothetical protein
MQTAQVVELLHWKQLASQGGELHLLEMGSKYDPSLQY